MSSEIIKVLDDEYIEKRLLLQTIRTMPTWFCDPGAKFFDGPQPPMEALLDPGEVIQTIAGMPSANAVKVVRCKDCRYRYLNEHFGFMCNLDSGDPYAASRNAEDDDWFCADGRRKDIQ